MEKGSIQIKLLGTSFSIQADEDPEYLARLVDYLKDKIADIEASVSAKDPLRVSILTSLLITDELFKEREKNKSGTSPSPEEDEEASRLAGRIIERLDKSLRDIEES